jgi:hypothetical protein
MTSASMRKLKSRWKPLGKLVAVIVGVPALLLVGGVLYFIYDEGDQVYRSRLYRAKYDIAAIETAAESFHKEYGSYPTDLQELVHTGRNGGGDKQFLMRIAPSPWGGPFRYAVAHGATGESIKVWAVPDRKTQDKLGVAELSNKTDWQAILK